MGTVESPLNKECYFAGALSERRRRQSHGSFLLLSMFFSMQKYERDMKDVRFLCAETHAHQQKIPAAAAQSKRQN
jgi:hypothetical protein